MKPRAKTMPSTIKVHVPIDFAIRGGRKLIIGERLAIAARPRIDNALIKAIARAYRWQAMIESGEYASIAELAEAEGINSSYASRIFRRTLLAPDIVDAVLDGKQALGFAIDKLRKRLPIVWQEQQIALGTSNQATR